MAAADEIAPGACKIVTVQGREIGVFNLAGEYFALINRCPHEGAPVCRGRIVGLATADAPGQYKLTRRGELLRCPWHGWEFDIRTGQSWCAPDTVRARTYQVSVEPGEALAKGPFVAETVPVRMEAAYIVVDI